MSNKQFYKYKGYQRKKYAPELRTYKDIIFDSKIEMEYYKHLEENPGVVAFVYQPQSFKYMDFNCKLTNKRVIRSYTPDFFVVKKGKNKFLFELIDIKGGFSPIEWKIKKDAILQALNTEFNLMGKPTPIYVKYFADICVQSYLSLREGAKSSNIDSNWCFMDCSTFLEITKDRNGNWIELSKAIEQKAQYKKNRKNEVKELVNEFKIISKERVKEWKNKKNPCFLLDFILPYLHKVSSSKAWRSYPRVKKQQTLHK